METLEELKVIVDNGQGKYEQVSLCGGIYYRFDGSNWIGIDADEVEFVEHEMPATRSLSDIKAIIELMESNRKLKSEYDTLEYNLNELSWRTL